MATDADAALQTLHDRHGSDLRRFATYLTRDPHAAEDIVQEVMLRAWRDPGLDGRPPAQARAWLYAVTRNLVVDRWRSAAARHEAPAAELPEHASADSYGRALDHWLILDALATLSAEHRQVIAAAYYERRTVNDIADELQIPPGTVKSRLHYGMRSLRLALQAKGVTGP